MRLFVQVALVKGLNMRLKQYLLASAVCVLPFAASAADLPVKAPVRVVQPVPFTWTGFYVGGSLGLISQGTVGTDLDNDPRLGQTAPGSTYGITGSPGAIFGVNAGYNYQMGAVVLGIEADIAGSTLDNTVNQSVFSNGEGDSCRWGFRSRLSALGTVRGRIGYAFDRALLYATGGLAFGRVHNSATNDSGEPGQQYDSTKWKTGWTAGGGLEYAVTNNWTVRVEGLYVDLGTTTVANAPNSGCRFAFKNTYTLARLGMNYKF
jgi:outer membrane immunogenic protein